MKNITLYFQVHQPFRLKQYRFFSIGKDHFYFDDFLNRTVLQRVAEQSYLPMNELLLRQIEKSEGKFKVAFSISGMALLQFAQYAPSVLDSFKRLAATGAVEFLCETWSHSLASLSNRSEFERQVLKHRDEIEKLFGVRPTTFRNTELIYSDHIGEMASQMGFDAILAEGAKQVLGWKSPNFVYANATKQDQSVLLRNYRLSDDIAFRFNGSGLTGADYAAMLKQEEGECLNLFMDYETSGEHNKKESGIFEFFESFIECALCDEEFKFATPAQTAAECQSVGVLHSPHYMSWADEERDLSAWLGNELQDEAFSKINALRDRVIEIDDPNMTYVYEALQTSDHFYYMCTKWFSDGDVHSYFNPYDSPYDAFMNYMNVVSDFTREIEKLLPR